MKALTAQYNPTLESILMVEETIRQQSGECGKYQLWRRLPRKMMYQTFQVILRYLQESGKILVDHDGHVHWTYDPRGIKAVLASGVRLR